MNKYKNKRKHKINDEIRTKEVRLIVTGAAPQVISTREALKIADDEGKDLILINETQDPPIARIEDYNKFLYNFEKMEKERKRAVEMNDASPIQPDKASSDRDFDAAVAFCIGHLENIAVIVASHNEQSNLLATKLLQQKNIPLNHPHVHFSQLYGMSDNITFNLAKAGCSVSKYLPFGPIKDVIPYLMRRAQENSSVAGQTGRELSLIKKEMLRRGML